MKPHRQTIEAVVALIDQKIRTLRSDSEQLRQQIRGGPDNPQWAEWNAINSRVFIYEEVKRDVLALRSIPESKSFDVKDVIEENL